MKLRWIKALDGWVASKGNIGAKVRNPTGPLGYSHWSVWSGHKNGGSGGTSSVAASKREAEREVERFADFLKKQERP